MPTVSIKKLLKQYGKVTAVDNVDLEIEDGELVVLLGPSGCGKTTTLRCVAGLEEITDGEILIGDRLVSGRGISVPPEKRKIGMVFQSYAIWPHMSVRENVAYGLKSAGVRSAELHERVDKTLEMVGLTGYGERGASQLSGGQQQRVALARAAVMEPEILLFDEPLSNLDARLRERMRFELRDLQKRLGITAIYVTHDQQEAMALADRIILMNAGRMEQSGNPVEIYEAPRSLFAAEFVGQTNVLTGVLRITEGKSTLTLAPALELICVGEGGKDGTETDAVVRPERIRLIADPVEGPNIFPATILSRAYLGSLGEYGVKLGSTDLRIQSSPPGKWRIGQEVWIHIPPEDVRIIRRQ